MTVAGGSTRTDATGPTLNVDMIIGAPTAQDGGMASIIVGKDKGKTKGFIKAGHLRKRVQRGKLRKTNFSCVIHIYL